MADKLLRYRKKRDFTQTPEPPGGESGVDGNLYMIHKHDATRLHYDLRLQIGDVLKSWAVPKGPSLDPSERRLAVEVEEHPLDYGSFEGVIPQGQYGAGPALIWDRGTWAPMGDIASSLKKGTLKFRLAGEKLRGGWTLARLKRKKGETQDNWLLIKEHDTAADTDIDILDARPESVVSGREISDLVENERASARPVRLRPGSVKGTKRAELPKKIKPQLATAVPEPPQGADWVHEIKFDGYRTLARIADGDIRFLTRNGHDWTDKYGELSAAFAGLNCRTALIDGEVVVLDEKGISRFSDLQDALARGDSGCLVYYAFDLLHLNGWDLTDVTLLRRKALLGKLLHPVAGSDSALQFSEHIAGQGQEFFDQVSAMGLEGVVSKRAESVYRPGRSKSWLKAKRHRIESFAIVGYTKSVAAGGLAALLVADVADDGLRYAGRVGSGFSAAGQGDLEARLEDRKRNDPPLELPGNVPRGTLWVEPDLKALIAYKERTRDNHLRHPVFKGLREFKPTRAADRKRRRFITDMDLANIWVTNPDRRLFSRTGPKKLDLAVYYAAVGDFMLPHILNRPVSFVRCPTGKSEDCFFQRHPFAGMPEQIGSFRLDKGEDKTQDYLVVENAAGYLALAQFGVVEFHTWGCRTDRPDLPDRMVIDLDPGPNVDWATIVTAAREVKANLVAIGLTPFVKTTGGKGLHVTVPIQRRYGWKRLHAASGAVAAELARENPRIFTTSMAKRDRMGRIYIDFHRNVRSATAVAPYSARVRGNLTVSAPISWEDLGSIDGPAELNYISVPELLTKYGDPWSDMDKTAGRLPKGLGA